MGHGGYDAMPCGFKPLVSVLINLYDPGGVFLRHRIFLSFCNTNNPDCYQPSSGWKPSKVLCQASKAPGESVAIHPSCHQTWLYTELDFEPELMAFQMVQLYLWSLWAQMNSPPKKTCRRAILATSRTWWFVWETDGRKRDSPVFRNTHLQTLTLKSKKYNIYIYIYVHIYNYVNIPCLKHCAFGKLHKITQSYLPVIYFIHSN